MQFVKMNGIGNDYVFIDARTIRIENPNALSVLISNRNYSVGSDGLVLIENSKLADCKMRIFNSDGSEANMCGNAIRCVAKYMFDNGFVEKTVMDVETLSGIKNLQITASHDKAELIKVNMGIPKAEEGVLIGGFEVTKVDIGNPHAVLITDNLDEKVMEKLRSISLSQSDGINAEAVRVINRKSIEMRVYERGSGETLSCGTGASAAMYALYLKGLVDDDVEVRLRGGRLRISYKSGRLFMQGDAKVNFKGEFDING